MTEALLKAVENHKAAKSSKHNADMTYLQAVNDLRSALADCGIGEDDLGLLIK